MAHRMFFAMSDYVNKVNIWIFTVIEYVQACFTICIANFTNCHMFYNICNIFTFPLSLSLLRMFIIDGGRGRAHFNVASVDHTVR